MESKYLDAKFFEIKQRSESSKKKHSTLTSSTDCDTISKFIFSKQEDQKKFIIPARAEEIKKKPIIVFSSTDDKLLKNSSCKNFKILDASKRHTSTSPVTMKKSIAIPKVGKSTTPSRPQKPIIVKSVNAKPLIVKSRP